MVTKAPTVFVGLETARRWSQRLLGTEWLVDFDQVSPQSLKGLLFIDPEGMYGTRRRLF